MKQVRNRSWWGRKFNPQERAWIRLEDWFFFLCKGYFLNEHSLPGDGKSQTDTRVRLIYFLKTNGEVRKAHVLFLSKTSIGLGCYFNALSVDRHQSESASERAWKWPDSQSRRMECREQHLSVSSAFAACSLPSLPCEQMRPVSVHLLNKISYIQENRPHRS